MRIGVLGGTFDPIHNGHLYLAREAQKRLCLGKVIFIPAYLPPHKKGVKVTHARHRYGMVKLAIKGAGGFRVSDVEIKRKGRSYSIQTLKQLRKLYGARTEIFFITGSDSLKEINIWKDLRGILGLCKFVVVERPNFSIVNPRRSFIVLRIDAKDISATDIRKRIRSGQSIKKLVPAKVKAYIKRNHLYGAAKNI